MTYSHRGAGSDFASMASPTHIAPAPRTPEEVRRAQINIAALCLDLWPSEALEATREILGMLGLDRKTGLEASPAS